MSNPYIEVLVEDFTSQRFITRLLTGKGSLGCTSDRSGVFNVMVPEPGRGDAKQAVFLKLEELLKGWRRRRAARPASAFLVVMLDADNESVEARERTALKTVRSALGLTDHPTVKECLDRFGVLILVSRWSIESWVRSLGGQEVDEGVRTPKGDKYRITPEEVSSAALLLAQQMKSGGGLPASASSLQRAVSLLRTASLMAQK